MRYFNVLALATNQRSYIAVYFTVLEVLKSNSPAGAAIKAKRLGYRRPIIQEILVNNQAESNYVYQFIS